MSELKKKIKTAEHKLGEEECTVGHMKMERNKDGDLAMVSRGQCRWCSQCIQWVRPKDFNTECNPASHKEHEDAT